MTRSQAIALCSLSSLAMAYGWGWRGSYGHEAGAMLPGALLGMSICLASGRDDWYRRTAIAGLCGAIGWSWGGSLSNMEQTFYVVSDSTPDVLWAFACIFLVGLLWSGIGSAILSFALTLPRSVVNGFIGPLLANGAALFAASLVLSVRPDYREWLDDFGATHLHDTKFLAATIILVVSSAYWIVRPSERSQAGLFARGAVGWWIGYLAFSGFGGILLAPPNRSEGWGGCIGVWAVLLIYLGQQQNRAGVWLALGGSLAGGVAFVLALFLTHPLVVKWRPFADTTISNTWKLTEESFGFLMGLGVAMTALGLLRGNLRPPEEDAPRAGSDLAAVFVLLVPMMWMNLHKNVRDWRERYDLLPTGDVGGLSAEQWFLLLGLVFTAVVLYALWRVRGRRAGALLPPTPFGKGALLFLVVLWIAQSGVALHRFADWKQQGGILTEVNYWLLAGLTTLALLTRLPAGSSPQAAAAGGRAASDRCWRAGFAHWTLWALVGPLIVAVSYGAMAMQDGPHEKSRLRFGPGAYWRQELEREQGKPSTAID